MIRRKRTALILVTFLLLISCDALYMDHPFATNVAVWGDNGFSQNSLVSPKKVSHALIQGITPPEYNAVAVSSISETDQYTGIISWSPSVTGTFAAETVYTATIELTSKPGYTLTGVPSDFFILPGADHVSYNAGSKTIEAEFPITGLATGTPRNFSVGGVSFTIVYVAGGFSCPKGYRDTNGYSSVDDNYWIAESEVTYELWYKVYQWATNDVGDGVRADGGLLYTIVNPGIAGKDGTPWTETGSQEPVTSISVSDSVVWCNALTEYYNAEHGTSLQCVYFSGGDILRDSTTRVSVTNVSVNAAAKGFRLPIEDEWYIAARYIDGTQWNLGDHVSGDTSGACFFGVSPTPGTLDGRAVSTVFGDYSWYGVNSGSDTHPVKTKSPNQLGLYDMCGNVSEFSYLINSYNSLIHGGSWYYGAQNLQLGIYNTYINSSAISNKKGFRIGKSY